MDQKLHKLPLKIPRKALIDFHMISGPVWSSSLCVCARVNQSLNQHLLQDKSRFGTLADNFGNLGKNNSGNILVGDHAGIFLQN